MGTWNVGGKAPHEAVNLRDWLLGSPPRLADLYVIGQVLFLLLRQCHSQYRSRSSCSACRFQEIVPLNAGNVLGAEDKAPAATWLSLIRRALNAGQGGGGGYCLAASKQMVGIFLCVWAREGVAAHVRNVKVSCVGTGIMGYMGNKVSVGYLLMNFFFFFSLIA